MSELPRWDDVVYSNSSESSPDYEDNDDNDDNDANDIERWLGIRKGVAESRAYPRSNDISRGGRGEYQHARVDSKLGFDGDRDRFLTQYRYPRGHQPSSRNNISYRSEDDIVPSPSPARMQHPKQQRTAPTTTTSYDGSFDNRAAPSSSAGPSSTNPSQRNISNEIFSCREFMLQQTEIFTVLVDCLKSAEEYVNNDGEFDVDAVNKLLSCRRGNYKSGIDGIRRTVEQGMLTNTTPMLQGISVLLPKEAIMLDAGTIELVNSLRSCLKCIAQCFRTHKSTFLSQLKKMREVSNTAIRATLQNERAENTSIVGKLREEFAAKWEEKALTSENTIHRLTLELEEARKQLLEYRRLVDNAETNKSLAVESAIHEIKLDFERERSRVETAHRDEVKRLKDDIKTKMNSMVEQQRSQLEMTRKHEEEVRDLMNHDKRKLEEEILKLRDQVMHALTQVSHEKDRCASKVLAERASAEREIQNLQAEMLKTQAQLQLQHTQQLQSIQEEEGKRYRDTLDQRQKEMEAMVVTHALEIDKINERHKTELKRNQTGLDIRLKEEMVRMKHLHEQEINRMLRENERLQKVIARYGGGGELNARSLNGFSSAAPNASVDKTSSGGGASRQTKSLMTGVFAPGQMQSAYSLNRFAAPRSDDAVAEKWNLRESSARHNDSSFPKSAIDKDEIEPEPSPGPPKPASGILNSTIGNNSGTSSRLNWGALQDSLAKQESARTPLRHHDNGLDGTRGYGSPANLSSSKLRSTVSFGNNLTFASSGSPIRFGTRLTPSTPPPDTFALDEALASAQEVERESASGLREFGGPVEGGVPIAETVKRVEGYLGQLQEYLEDEENYTRPTTSTKWNHFIGSVAEDPDSDDINLLELARMPLNQNNSSSSTISGFNTTGFDATSNDNLLGSNLTVDDLLGQARQSDDSDYVNREMRWNSTRRDDHDDDSLEE